MSDVTLPNLITVGRLIIVPLVVWFITEERLDLAFWFFLLAGISDGLDGWIARRFDLRSALGAFLDPIADKVLLVSIYVTLSVVGILPHWLVILVVSRDVLIVGAFLLTWVMEQPIEAKPLMVSKVNTAAQITLAVFVLGGEAFRLQLGPLIEIGVYVTGALTAISGGAYVLHWLTAMSADPGSPGLPNAPKSSTNDDDKIAADREQQR